MTNVLEAALREAREFVADVEDNKRAKPGTAKALCARIDAILSAASGGASGDDDLPVKLRPGKVIGAWPLPAPSEAPNVERAYDYAVTFLKSFVEKNFPDNPPIEPLPDMLGVLTQIDNATTITSQLRARIAELEKERDAIREAKP